MTFYAKSEDWLHQSSLLLEARPETTRVVTRYRLRPARRRTAAEKKAEADGETPAEPTTTKPPRGHLEIKTYDPVSGVTLKYKTSKAAEVSRLVQMLGGLGRRMAALPPAATVSRPDETMLDADADAVGSGVQTPVPGAAAASGSSQAPGQQGGGVGKGKKKKGKR